MVNCCPDTGATQSVVCEKVAKQANLEIFPPRIGMVSLTGYGPNIVGESNVCFTFEGIKHETAESAADVKMEVPVLVRSLKLSILSSTSLRRDKAF